MPAPSPNAAEAFAFGPFDATADEESIAAYARATGGAGTPFVFPIALMSAPGAQAALKALIGAGFLPVHESQSFEAERPLAPGAYVLSGTALRERAPQRLTIEAEVATPAGRTVARLRTALRLFPAAGIDQ